MARLFENTNLVERKDAGIGEHTIDRVATVPNAITLVRGARDPPVPCFVVRLGQPWRRRFPSRPARGEPTGSTAMSHGASTKARPSGKMFDPVVDRLLLVVGIVASIIAGAPPAWYAWLVLAREVLVSCWVLAITARGAKRMDVTWWGKCAAFANMGAFPAFLLAAEPSFSEAVATGWRVFAWCCAVPGIVLGVISAVQYVPLGLTALRAGRSEREGSAATG